MQQSTDLMDDNELLSDDRDLDVDLAGKKTKPICSLNRCIWRCPQWGLIQNDSSNLKENDKQKDDSSFQYFVVKNFSLSVIYDLMTWKFQGFSQVRKMWQVSDCQSDIFYEATLF